MTCSATVIAFCAGELHTMRPSFAGSCGLDDAHGAEPGQQIGVEAGVRRRHEEALSARSGLRDGVWPVVGKKSKSAGNLHAAFLETRLGEQTEHMSHCILPGAEFP